MKIGRGRDCDSDLWQGRHVSHATAVLIDGKETKLKVQWFDPDNDTYGFLVTDQDGRPQIDPEDDGRLWTEVGHGKVTLEWPPKSNAIAPAAQGL